MMTQFSLKNNNYNYNFTLDISRIPTWEIVDKNECISVILFTHEKN